jgi:hypothetical protein
LEESIDVCREALDLLPESHPNRSSSLSNLAKALSTRFQQTGQLADLEESIGLHRKALELFSGSHPDQSASLNNLAKPLSTRFQQTGLRADLEESIGFLTTPIARDNNVFWLTRGNDGRYTVATWAIHGIQIGMLFRVNSPPAILRVTEILKSSSILEAYDASADIPSGVAAFAIMNLGMKVFLEPPFALPSDLSMIDSCFTIVPERQHADLILSLESLDGGDKLLIESVDPLLCHLSCHVTGMKSAIISLVLSTRLHTFGTISGDTVILATLSQHQRCRHMSQTAYSLTQNQKSVGSNDFVWIS